jgi:hypothetical protein
MCPKVRLRPIDGGITALVIDPIDIQRRIRRSIDKDGLRADIAADVNVIVSTGGGSATARQDAPIRQGRSARAGQDAPPPKEQP